jgi:nuclear transport factor 2 (NTF2) superfamily protein
MALRFYAIEHADNPGLYYRGYGAHQWTVTPFEAMRHREADNALETIVQNLNGRGRPVLFEFPMVDA